MARPNKHGIDTFPFPAGFFTDSRVTAISGEFGTKGAITLVALLCAIYQSGYFIQWSAPVRTHLMNCLPGISSGLLECIVNRLVKWDYFNGCLFNSTRILTSREIQERYFRTIRNRKTELNKLPYLLIDPEIVSYEFSTKKLQGKENEKEKEKNPPCTPLIKEKDKEKEKDPAKNGNLELFKLNSSDSSTEEYINYNALMNLFNDMFRQKLPQITVMTQKRRLAVKARIAEHGKNAVMKVLHNVCDSRFLTGDNNKAWRADFDWIFRPANFIKILEGNYNDRENNGKKELILKDNSPDKYIYDDEKWKR